MTKGRTVGGIAFGVAIAVEVNRGVRPSRCVRDCSSASTSFVVVGASQGRTVGAFAFGVVAVGVSKGRTVGAIAFGVAIAVEVNRRVRPSRRALDRCWRLLVGEYVVRRPSKAFPLRALRQYCNNTACRKKKIQTKIQQRSN